MAISKARRRLRIVLGILLVLSFGFFGTMAYTYVQIRQHNIKILDIAPTLFKADILQHQAWAFMLDDNGKTAVAINLINKSVFSRQYKYAGLSMLEGIAEKGYAPAQYHYATITLARYSISMYDKKDALEYYKKSARQGYQPAIEKLAMLEEQNFQAFPP